MANQQNEAISERGQSVNWLVGLSGAALGGALAKFDWLLKLSGIAKVAVVIASFFFLFSILAGVYYAFQLLAVKSRKETLAALRAQSAPADTTATAEKEFKQEDDKARSFHNATMASFGLAGISTIIALAVGLFSPVPAKEVVPRSKYAITTSEVVRNGRVIHSHTFLLNRETGEVWETVCREANLVEFRRVPKTSYDGSPEEPPVNPVVKKP